MNRLQNKNVVITGASSGIGKKTAIMLASEGAKVVLAARRVSLLEEVAAAIKEAGGEAYCVPTDISDHAAVKNLIHQAVSLMGTVDVMVNCAGVLEEGLPSIEKMKEEDLERDLSINSKGTIYCMQEASLAMLEAGKGGSIVNVASIAALKGNGGAAYAASKGAVLSASRHAALRLNRDNIRVNCICPGSVNTPMTAALGNAVDMDLINQLLVHSDIRRNPMACEPEHVAHLIVYLASDESLPVSGQNIVMDYGVNL